MTTGLAQIEDDVASPRFGCNCAVKPERVARPQTIDTIRKIQLHFKNSGFPPCKAENFSTKVTERANMAVDRVINCFVTSLAKSKAFDSFGAINISLSTKRPQSANSPALNECACSRFGERLRKPIGFSRDPATIQAQSYFLHSFVGLFDRSLMLFILVFVRKTLEDSTCRSLSQISGGSYRDWQGTPLPNRFHELAFNIKRCHAGTLQIEIDFQLRHSAIDRFYHEMQPTNFVKFTRIRKQQMKVVGEDCDFAWRGQALTRNPLQRDQLVYASGVARP